MINRDLTKEDDFLLFPYENIDNSKSSRLLVNQFWYTVKNIRRIENEKRVYESATYSKPF